MIAVEDDSNYLSHFEVEASINAISDGDWKRLSSHSRLMSLGIPEMVNDELMHEALVRLLAGERHWKRGVNGFTTVYKIMHSIASDTRKMAREGPMARYMVVNEGGGGDDDADEETSQQNVAATTDDTPEMALWFKEVLEILERLIGGNEEEMGVLQCWISGVTGKTAAAELEISMKVYDAARKRLDRKIEAAGNKGK